APLPLRPILSPYTTLFRSADDKAALAAARRAAELRPDWEAPVVMEAQVLQKRSTAEAAKRLAQFVEKNPNSREGRLNYARALILDRKSTRLNSSHQIISYA